MPSDDVTAAQDSFLRDGGLFAAALREKRKSGEIARSYDPADHPYPKVLYFDRGPEPVKRSTETVDRKTIEWTETVQRRDAVTVYSEDEEDRVRDGGATDVDNEDERQSLLQRARALKLRPKADWSLVRLRRELDAAMNAPEPIDEMAVLQKQLDDLNKMAAMKAQIAELQAQLAVSSTDDLADLRAQLTSLGVKFDGRWSAARLRQALDEATAPGVAA